MNINCGNYTSPYRYFPAAELDLELNMLCTICKKKLKTSDTATVWRTLNTVLSGMPRQWAQLPIHDDCKQAAESELIKCKIQVSAGHDNYAYLMNKPNNVDEREIDEYFKLRINRRIVR